MGQVDLIRYATSLDIDEVVHSYRDYLNTLDDMPEYTDEYLHTTLLEAKQDGAIWAYSYTGACFADLRPNYTGDALDLIVMSGTIFRLPEFITTLCKQLIDEGPYEYMWGTSEDNSRILAFWKRLSRIGLAVKMREQDDGTFKITYNGKEERIRN